MKLYQFSKNLAPVLLIFVVALAFISPFLFTNKIPYAGDFSGSDLTELNLPLRYAAAQSFLAGQVPLWQQNLANGFALTGEGQTGVFYPLNFVFLIFSFTVAVNITFFLNFFLAGVFTYFYARIFKISVWGSIFAALSFAFCGFFVFHLKHLNMINAAIWLPLIFYLIEKYFLTAKKTKCLIVLALVFAVQFFAGHPQISYISIFSSFIYFVLKFYWLSPGLKKVPLADLILKVIIPWMMLGLIVFGFSAVQFFPTLELSSFSERNARMNFDSSTVNIFPPRQLLTVFNPYLFGNPAINEIDEKYGFADIFWENSCYFGWLPALLAFLALICLFKTERQIKFYSILILIFLFFIFGRYNLLYIWAWLAIPGLKVFRFSQRFLLPFILIFTVLAGLGFDLFFKLFKIILLRFKLKKINLIISAGILFFLIILIVDVFSYTGRFIGALSGDYYKPNQVSEWLSQEQSREYSRYLSVNWGDSWASTNANANGWQSGTELHFNHRQLIQPDFNLFFNLATADDRGWGEGGQIHGNLASLWHNTAEHKSLDFENKAVVLDDIYLKVYGMQNTKHFLSYYEIKNNNLKLIKSFESSPLPDLRVYENNYFLPRAFLVYNFYVETDPFKSLEKISNDFYDFSNEVILAKIPDNISPTTTTNQLKTVEIKSWGNNRIEIVSDSDRPGIVFLSLTNYPGWQALVNNQKAEILTANHTFSALVVPAGKSEIILKFQPFSFYLGLAISLATVILVMLYLIISYFYKKKSSHE